MEELLWSMSQGSRVLQDLRKELRGFWQDEAARELTSRYLDPHEVDDQQMLDGLNQQKNALDQSQVRLVSAEHFGRLAEEHADIVAEKLKSAHQELQSSYGNYDNFANYNSEANSKLPLVWSLIAQANSACGS